ncbi:MAG: hypothetical protein JW874_07235, partial [Spirochaetales bacterium]|nr:hypothetical protein [Spirochaetales bacterium]
MIIRRKLNALERKTMLADTIRIGSESFVNPMLESLILLIAIRFFMAGDMQKGILSAARYVGMMAGLFAGSFLGRTGIKKTSILALISIIAALFLISGAFSPSSVLFTVFLFLYQMFMDTRPTFITAIYSDNYREEIRGRTITVALVISTMLALLISYTSGRVLDRNIADFRYLLAFFGVLLLVSSFLFTRIPSQPVRSTGIMKSFAL